MDPHKHCTTCGLSYGNTDTIGDLPKFTVGRSFHMMVAIEGSRFEEIFEGSFLRGREAQAWDDLMVCCKGHLDVVLCDHDALCTKIRNFSESCYHLESLTGLMSGDNMTPAEVAEKERHGKDRVYSLGFLAAFEELTYTTIKPAKEK